MTRQHSYGQILKSSTIIGGASGISMLFSIIRTKFAAVLIGTSGVGLLANFTVIQGLVNTVAGLGISLSAVRDVASAAAKDDQQGIGRAVLTLRRVCWLTGLLGMVMVVILSPLIGQLTFDSHEHDIEIAALGLIILFVNLSNGQTALIRGMRRIGDMGKLTIIGAAVGAIVSIAFYFWLGLQGIVPALVLTAAVQLAVTWNYARKVPVPQVKMTWKESFGEAGGMVKLGIATMWTSLVGSVVAYATVAMITNQFDLHAVGIYSAAYALSGMFVGFVLQAMSADYFPRLTGAVEDKAVLNRLVNEQTEIGLLLAVPGIMATLLLAPWIIQLFYTKEFLPAVGLLHWFILGCLIRVIQWPMGYLQLALGRSTVWVSTQTSLSVLHLGLIWVGLQLVGVEGVSMAFLALYMISLIVIKLVARYLIGHSWSKSVRRLLMLLVSAVMLLFLSNQFIEGWKFLMIGGGFTLLVSLFCLRELIGKLGEDHRLTKLLVKLPGFRRMYYNA